MRFKRIAVENIRCFADATVEFDRGVTVVHGPNGSGKTTLLEAAFFALYGSKALDETLDQFITTEATEATVTLWFLHDGTEYRIHRRLRRRDDRATTAECTLETETETITGARNVRERVSTLLRMDAEAFVNCAYVRQGEINKLIHASPATRQDIIDGLLQLGVLETYRDRAGRARLAVEDHLGELTGELSGLAERIEAKEEAELPAQLNDLQTEQADVESDIDRLEEQLEAARTRREEATELLDEYEEKKQRHEELQARIEDLEATIAETESTREELRDRLRKLRENRDTLADTRDELARDLEIDDLSETAIETALSEARNNRDELTETRSEIALEHQGHRDAAETAGERGEELEQEAATKESRAEELSEEITAAETELQSRREDLEALIEDREQKKAKFSEVDFAFGDSADELAEIEEAHAELTETMNETRAELEAVTERIDRGETLLQEDRCPECGQKLDGAPRLESLSEDRSHKTELTEQLEELERKHETLEQRRETAETFREHERTIDRLDERIETARELITDREETLSEKRDRLNELREEAAELAKRAENAREEATAEREAAVACQEELDAIDAELSTVETRIEKLERLRETQAEFTSLTDDIEQLRERRSLLAEQNEERKQTLTELQRERAELKTELDSDRIETAREEKERAEAYIEEHEPTLEQLRARRDELQEEIGRVRAELAELNELKDRYEHLSETQAALEQLKDETETLESVYDELKTELRLRNVQILDDLLNETFELVYRNDAYDRIELSTDYELTVYQKDGTALEPTQLSGGERALFNLSLRSAIYRLLAEGIDGSAPMPPLILDEPTVFLDSGHVSQLVALIDAMRELGVEQILVVSHDDELVDAAETLITVEKDPTTNRSRVHRQPRQLPDMD